MPPVIGAAIVNAGLSVGISVGTGIFIAQAVTTVGGALILGAASAALAKKPRLSSGPGLGFLDGNRLTTVREPTRPWQIVYGRTRVGGTITFLEQSADKRYRHAVITLAGHALTAIEEIYFNDELVPLDASATDGAVQGRYAGVAWIRTSLGDEAAGTQPFPELVDEAVGWQQDSRQDGKAKIWLKIKQDANRFPGFQLPQLSAVVKGRKVFDPREAGHDADDPTTWAWSDNPFLCLNDYRCSDEFGLGADYATRVDATALIAAANKCDETVAVEGVWQQVAQDAGTAIGDMTDDGGAGNSLAAAFDDDWGHSNSSGVAFKSTGRPAYVGKDWGAGTTRSIAGFRIAQPENVSAMGVDGVDNVYFTLQGSSDNATWVDLSDRVAERTVAGRITTVRRDRISDTTAYRYHRVAVEIVGKGTATYVAELQFFELATSQARYTLNGSFGTDLAPRQILLNMLSSAAGKTIILGGTWFDYAGAYRSPALTLTEADLRGPVGISTLVSRQQGFNGIKGLFVNAEAFWQPDDFPAVDGATWLAEDSAKRRWKDIQLPFTDSGAMAQRVAAIDLERVRRQITAELPCMGSAYRLAPPDTLQVTLGRYGWSSKIFEVSSLQLVGEGDDDGPRLGVDLTLREIDSDVFQWPPRDGETLQPSPRSALVVPTEIDPPGFTLADDVIATGSGAPVTRLIASIAAPDDGFVDGYQAQYRLDGEADDAWRNMDVGSALTAILAGAEDGATYDVRVRALASGFGGRSSAWVQKSRTVVGQPEPPADVEDFAVNVVGATAHLSWARVTDPDLKQYRVRFANRTSGATWNDGIEVDRAAGHATGMPVAALIGTYMIKAVDWKGNESVNAALSVTTVPALRDFNAVETIDEGGAGFAGSHAGTVVLDGNLVLDGADVLSDWTLISDIPLISFGEDGYQASGVYTFGERLDLGEVYDDVRLSADVTVVGTVPSNLVSTWADFASLASLSAATASNVTTRLQLRTTEDDPDGSPVAWGAWRDFTAGEFRLRAAEFRLVMTTGAVNATPSCSALKVEADMPDRVEAEQGKTAAAAGTAVTYPTGFRAVPALGITGVDLNTGDYWRVTSESATGFTIRFFDSAGNGVERTYNYVAKGYGRAG